MRAHRLRLGTAMSAFGVAFGARTGEVTTAAPSRAALRRRERTPAPAGAASD